MVVAFWICLSLIVYTFVGYGLILFILVKIKRLFTKAVDFITNIDLLPTVTLVIAAYNEEDLISEKITNSLQLNYPKDRIKILFVTDGSNDKTPEKVRACPGIILLHQDLRAGKMAAIKRAIPFVASEIIVFTDANTFLNEDAILELVKHYQNPKVGAVAGEKRILVGDKADASSAGEGFYWKYESLLKKLDYELYSNVGAAGELFSIRTALYQPVESDTIIDDHMIAMRIAENGYVIAYEANAYAMETASANTKEELKRKIRIAAGGIQSILRLKRAANPFYYPILTFQYISHRVLRWTIIPILLIVAFVLNALIVLEGASGVYGVLFTGQVLFYLLSLAGLFFESRNIRIKAFFIPYYFCIMNYAVVAGIIKYFRNNQSAAWEKSKRKAL
ncbi:MAG: glycosyltransferase family 2 protein [Candidatus Pedobacter colombiensis]|uniref:Glycosyltransferase family 2 protein n=1 Tax=Candidatus Pedobacter colombiensis TaxID=3121371 RepID=A0AAJ6B8T7_9SPHI|nr:glycosyltransferase family 2 protein [Pedobacter sp.]WEK21229.1 MAG: glycosyltransferase family 2 protein [Pedobacter sp.]